MAPSLTDLREKARQKRDEAAKARRAAAVVTLPVLRKLFLDYAEQCDARADQLERLV